MRTIARFMDARNTAEGKFISVLLSVLLVFSFLNVTMFTDRANAIDDVETEASFEEETSLEVRDKETGALQVGEGSLDQASSAGSQDQNKNDDESNQSGDEKDLNESSQATQKLSALENEQEEPSNADNTIEKRSAGKNSYATSAYEAKGKKVNSAYDDATEDDLPISITEKKTTTIKTLSAGGKTHRIDVIDGGELIKASWDHEQSGDLTIEPEDLIGAGTVVLRICNPEETKVLYVIIEVSQSALPYTLSYNLDGGKLNGAETIASKQYGKGAQVTVVSGTPEKEGFTFLGWYNGETKVEQSFAMPGENLELVAKWQSNAPEKYAYTVKYCYGGTVDEARTVTNEGNLGEEINEYLDKPKDGYAFDKVDNLPLKISDNAESNVIYVHYATDVVGTHVDPSNPDNNLPGDGIPDKYQATVKFEVVNGEWTDDVAKSMVVTLTDANGIRSETGSYVLKPGEIPGSKASYGYQVQAGNWEATKNGEIKDNKPYAVNGSGETIFKITYAEDATLEHHVSYVVDYYKDGEKIDSDSEPKRESKGWVLAPVVVNVDKDVISGFAKKYDGYIVEYIQVDSNRVTDIPGSFSIAAKESDADHVIAIHYTKDEIGSTPGTEKGDGVPDKYQATVVYANGENGEIDPCAKWVITLKNGTESATEQILTPALVKEYSVNPSTGYSHDSWVLEVSSGPETLSLLSKSPSEEICLEGGKTYTYRPTFKKLLYTYTVRYIDAATKKSIHNAKRGEKTPFGDIVKATDEIIEIPGYEYVSATPESIKISTAATANTLTLVYKKRAELNLKTLKIKYIDEETNSAIKDEDIVGGQTPGDKVSVTLPSIEGYLPVAAQVNGADSSIDNNVVTATIGENGAEVTFYYKKRTDLSYTVKYLERIPGADAKEIALPKMESGKKFGEKITEEPIEIPGFKADAAYKGEITITADSSKNVINFYYTRLSNLSYTVNYFLEGTDTKIAPSKKVENQVFEAIATEVAPAFAGYRLADDKDLIEVADGDATGLGKTLKIAVEGNEINFYYTRIPSTPVVQTTYTVRHLFQNVDGVGYSVDASLTETVAGAAGSWTNASAMMGLEGFTAQQPIAQQVIAADGTTVVDIYYNRNTYVVEYQYTGDVPAGASALPVTQTYRFGQAVAVAPNATAEGYVFSGWSISGAFEMPASNVVITGSFTPATVIPEEPVVPPTPPTPPTPVVPVPTPVVPTPTPTPATPAGTAPAAPATPAAPASATPAPAATPAATPAAPATTTIDDDATPQAAAPTADRQANDAGEAINDEATPMGAFDEPHCWVHWVMLLGIVLTIVYGIVVVRRRLSMTDDVDDMENQILGRVEDRQSVSAPVTGHQAL